MEEYKFELKNFWSYFVSPLSLKNGMIKFKIEVELADDL